MTSLKSISSTAHARMCRYHYYPLPGRGTEERRQRGRQTIEWSMYDRACLGVFPMCYRQNYVLMMNMRSENERMTFIAQMFSTCSVNRKVMNFKRLIFSIKIGMVLAKSGMTKCISSMHAMATLQILRGRI